MTNNPSTEVLNLPFVFCERNNDKITVSVIVPVPKGSKVSMECTKHAHYTVSITCPKEFDPREYEIFSFSDAFTGESGTQVHVCTDIKDTPGGPKRGTVSLPDSLFPQD